MSENSPSNATSRKSQSGRPKPRPEGLTGAQRRYVRAKAHHLKPLVSVGKAGITEGVIEATQDALRVHELIKVSLPAESSDQKKALSTILGESTGSHIIQTIGHIVVLFRQKKDGSVFALPKHKQTNAS